MVLTADDIAVITHIVTTTMASMPMQQQAATAPHPEGAQRVVDERHWMEGLLFPVQGSLLCWTELEQSDIDPLDGYATTWRLVRLGHLLHIEGPVLGHVCRDSLRGSLKLIENGKTSVPTLILCN